MQKTITLTFDYAMVAKVAAEMGVDLQDAFEILEEADITDTYKEQLLEELFNF